MFFELKSLATRVVVAVEKRNERSKLKNLKEFMDGFGPLIALLGVIIAIVVQICLDHEDRHDKRLVLATALHGEACYDMEGAQATLDTMKVGSKISINDDIIFKANLISLQGLNTAEISDFYNIDSIITTLKSGLSSALLSDGKTINVTPEDFPIVKNAMTAMVNNASDAVKDIQKDYLEVDACIQQTFTTFPLTVKPHT